MKLTCPWYIWQEQLELMSQWASVQSPVLVKLYGLSLNSPLGLVMELLPLGPLDAYLQHNSSRVKEVDLVEAANYLATALWNLVSYIHGLLEASPPLIIFCKILNKTISILECLDD